MIKVLKAYGLARKGIKEPIALSAFLIESTYFNVPDWAHKWPEPA